MRKKISGLSTSVLPVAAVCFFWLIYSPLDLLFGNEVDLSYNMYTLLGYMFPAFLVAVIILTVSLQVVRRENRRVWQACVLLLLFFLLSSYIQGVYLSTNLPPLDGREIHWNEYSSERTGSILLWSLLFIVFLIIFFRVKMERLERITSFFSGAFLLLMATAIMITCITTEGFHRNNGILQSDTYLFDMSEQENLVIILLDAVDGERFREVMDEHPEYEGILEDFTSFDNVMACYPFTSRSVPFILSGQWYENEQPFREYCREALLTSPLFEKLQSDGYRMGFYDPSFSFIPELQDLFENISHAPFFRSPSQFLHLQLKLTGYRSLPFDLKRFCVITPAEISNATVRSNGIEGAYTWDNEPFLKRLQEKEIQISGEKCFRYIYLCGAHTPFHYPAQAERFADNSYESSVELCVTIMDRYLQKLKEAGVYDNTAIVFLSDHGYADGDISEGKQNPFLLIKGIHEKHAFVMNDEPVSHQDLQYAFARLLDGLESSSLFEKGKYESEGRRYLFFGYGRENHMEEYIQTGHAEDESTLIPTGRIYELGN